MIINKIIAFNLALLIREMWEKQNMEKIFHQATDTFPAHTINVSLHAGALWYIPPPISEISLVDLGLKLADRTSALSTLCMRNEGREARVHISLTRGPEQGLPATSFT